MKPLFSIACAIFSLVAVPSIQTLSRGYSIPLVDLSGDAARQVIVDREKGQYLGHPTTVMLEDGKTIIAVYPKGHGKGAIQMKRSTDAGRTWSERLPTPASWATSLETPTIFRIIGPNGKKRLIIFSGLFPIRTSISDNDGKTWSELSPIGGEHPFGGIVAMASLIRLKDGSYMALFHDDGRYLRKDSVATKPPVFVVYKTVSTDGGLNWSQPEAIASKPPVQLCEPGIVRSPDGRQIAVLLRENSRKANSHIIFSNDEGRTWTDPKELPGALTGDRHVAKYTPDGRLFITFRDTTLDSPTNGDWVAWVGHYDDLLKLTEGQYRIRLMKNNRNASGWNGDCAYPGLEMTRDGTLITTTYGHWQAGESPYIVSIRLKLEETDKLAKAAKK